MNTDSPDEDLVGLSTQQLEDKLAAARLQLADATQLQDRLTKEVKLLQARLIHQQLEHALADGGPAGVLHWWTRGQRASDDRRNATTAMWTWVRGLAPQVQTWSTDHCPDGNPRRPVDTFSIAWEVSAAPHDDITALAKALNTLGASVRAAQRAGRILPQLRILVCPPRTEMRFGDWLPTPCLLLCLTLGGWELVTAAGTPITLGASAEDCRPLLLQAQATARGARDDSGRR